MNKAQAAALLILGASVGVAGKSLVGSASAEAKRIATSNTLMRGEFSDGGVRFYARTASRLVFSDGGRDRGPTLAGIVKDPEQVKMCEAFWQGVVVPGLK